MPIMEEHGGECCGVKHVHDFDLPERDTAALDRVLKAVCPAGNPNRLSEVVLTDGQMQQGWGPILRARGFRLVARWRNSNSGNVCNMFVMVPTELSMEDADLPWIWEGDAHLQAAPALPGGVLDVGARVRYENDGGPIHRGTLGTVTVQRRLGWDVRWDTGQTGHSHNPRYLVAIPPIEQVVPEEFAAEIAENEAEGGIVYVESVVFVNIYRNGPSALNHPSLEAANAARNADLRVRCEERRSLTDGTLEVINHV